MQLCSGRPSVSTSQARVIVLNGNATSTIEVGSSYNDLAARIIVPETGINLGIVTVLDGATATTISIDPSTPGEHKILYKITSATTGVTGSAMRTVIASPADTGNPFDPPPEAAKDNASSTPFASEI